MVRKTIPDAPDPAAEDAGDRPGPDAARMTRPAPDAARMTRPAPDAAPKARPAPFRIRLPGLVSDRDIGLGDVVSQAAVRAGFRPCGGCRARADALNRWFVFTRRG